MPRGSRAARVGWAAVVGAVVGWAGPSPAADPAAPLEVIKKVGREGAGNDQARAAWKALVAGGAASLMPALAAFDDANPTANNWLRPAVDAIAEAERAAGRPHPADKLEAFLKDTTNAQSARRLAYELIVRQDPAAKERLLTKLLDDPQPDLRYDAVALALDHLERATPAGSRAEYERLLTAAREQKQVERIVARLEKDHKVKVSVAEHFGFVTHWAVAGPFDSTQGAALTTSHPPEKATAPAGAYKGKGGADVAWKPVVTAEKYATVDLNKAVGKHMDAAGYGLAVLVAEADTPCEVRAATPNAVQIYLNGVKLFEREEYHHGSALDYHVGKGVLKKGENVVVIKVAQNNQKDTWAQKWEFQLRVCDPTGGLLPGVTHVAPQGDRTKKLKLGFAPETAAPTEEKK